MTTGPATPIVSDWTSVDPGRVVPHPMPSGWTIGLPVVYTDWVWASAFFAARESSVRARLPSPTLQPLRLLPGVALVAVGMMRYGAITDVDPYDEFVVGFPVERVANRSFPVKAVFVSPALHPGSYHNLGLYVQHLPVSHPRALEFGVELWGFPKTVQPFAWDDTDVALQVTVGPPVGEPGRGLTLRVPRQKTQPVRTEQVTYTLQHDRVVETPVRFEGHFGVRNSGNGVALTLGTDRISHSQSTRH